MNNSFFSYEAEEMHAGAAEADERAEVLAELNSREAMDKQDAAEAMAEARGNDGVRPLIEPA